VLYNAVCQGGRRDQQYFGHLPHGWFRPSDDGLNPQEPQGGVQSGISGLALKPKGKFLKFVKGLLMLRCRKMSTFVRHRKHKIH